MQCNANVNGSREAPSVFDDDSIRAGGQVGHALPNGVDVRALEVACAVPAPTPDCGEWTSVQGA
jgi:hypothetical protein